MIGVLMKIFCVVCSMRIGRQSILGQFGMWLIGRRRRRGLRCKSSIGGGWLNVLRCGEL